MESFNGHCPHHSVPVEMDESMNSSSLDLVLPPACQQCLYSAPAHQQQEQQQRQLGYRQPNQPGPCDGRFYDDPAAGRPSTSLLRLAQQNPHAAHPLPNGHRGGGGGREGDVGGPGPHYHQDEGSSFYGRHGPVEDEDESLERPLPLVSNFNRGDRVQVQHPAVAPAGLPHMQADFARPCACCPPRNPLHHNNIVHDHCENLMHGNPEHPQRQHNPPPQPGRPACPQSAAPVSELIQEVSVGVGQSIPPPLGGSVREMKRTINLPDEYRNLFITYSVDAARDMWPFVKFLTNHGFRPVTDLIDDPVRRMAINRWMDRFLNDKSVLIIVAISPRYKAVVEGEVDDDDHGLNTKYIYSQIQTEYIQQGSSNFRLVPVLFPNATKRHVPTWLQSTRIYRWPLEVQDLLLRLAREERYIIPPPGRDLTLTIRTL